MAEELRAESHESAIKNPQQLVVVVMLAFAIPIAIIVLVSQFVMGGLRTAPSDAGQSAEAIGKRIQPVGEIVMAGGSAPAAAPAAAVAAPAPAPSAASAPAAAAKQDGKAVYDKVCAVCHGAGIAGAPKAGDKAAWGPRIGQGKNVLYEHAIKGIRAMPAKGGNAALSDDEVKAAVDAMTAMVK
ncbi:MAG: cytochrome c5 family protein [Betaproteobacteria bacterium]|nr:cytochrome c5 family protein [Betaproteobacteria bacterium]